MDIKINSKLDPRVYVTPTAYKKIVYLVEIAGKEVGWLGKVKELGNYRFVIDEIYLFEQEVTSAQTEMDAEGLAKWFGENIDIANEIKFWGHSHVNMTVGPSSTDTDQMQQFIKNGSEYFIMGIFNKRGEQRFDIYTKHWVASHVPFAVWIPDNEELRKEMEIEFKEKVSEPVYNYWNKRSNAYDPKNPQPRFRVQENQSGKGNGRTKPRTIAPNFGDGLTEEEWAQLMYGWNGNEIDRYSETQHGVRSLKDESTKDRHNRVRSDGKQDSNVAAKTGHQKRKNLGSGQGGRTQHPKSSVPDDLFGDE